LISARCGNPQGGFSQDFPKCADLQAKSLFRRPTPRILRITHPHPACADEAASARRRPGPPVGSVFSGWPELRWSSSFSLFRRRTIWLDTLKRELQQRDGLNTYPLNVESGHRPASALLDAGVGVVIVDALVVFRLHAVPGHVRMGVEFEGHISHEVLDENRVFVSPLGHRLFVLPLQQ